jgi:dihydroneopterin aldolase
VLLKINLAEIISKGNTMACNSTVELKDLRLVTSIGRYKPSEVVPDEHRLDLTLWINSHLVLINEDSMELVFDYDPLIAEIGKLANAKLYETQEMLISLIAKACAMYPQIEAAEIALCKSPVLSGTGKLGIRIYVDTETLHGLR